MKWKPIQEKIDEQIDQIENAYSYRRISRTSQSKGVGLNRQDDNAVAVTKERGWKLQPDSLVDLGYSAYGGENLFRLDAALKNFIDAAKAGKVLPNSVLLIDDFSRFSRLELDQSEDQFKELLRTGVAIFNSYNRKTYVKASLNHPMDKIEIILGFHAAYEYSENISRKVNDAFQRKYALAEEGKPVQLGYWQPAWVDFIGEKKSVGKFVKNSTASVVYGIVQDYLNGKSMMAIANRLNHEKTPCIGRKSKKGKRWSQGQVGYLLKSESLIGTITIEEQPSEENQTRVKHTFDHYYPPVISDDEWNRLQQKLDQNTNKRGGTREGEWISNLFPNRVRCGCCGGRVSTQNGKCGKIVQRYYKCLDARLNKDKCSVRQMLEISRVEDDFFLLFLQQHPSELLGKESVEHQSKMAEINTQIKNIETKIETSAKLFEQYPSERLAKQMADFETTKKNLVEQRNDVNRLMLAQTNAPQAVQDIRKAMALMDSDDNMIEVQEAVIQLQQALAKPEVRKQLVQLLPSLVDHITIDLEKGSYSITTTDQKTTPFYSVVHPSR